MSMGLLDIPVAQRDEGAQVRVTVRTPDGARCGRARDDGSGIDEHDVDQILHACARGSTRGPGSGLGCTLGRGLAEVQGGTLRARRPSSGCHRVFELRLPRNGGFAARPAPSSP